MSLTNKVQLIGNTGKDPVLNTTKGDKKVARISIATSESYFDSENQKWNESTQWHNLVAWDKMAERFEKTVKKGDRIVVSGKITYRKYLDNNNVEKLITEIVVNEFENQTYINNQRKASLEN